MSLCVVHEHFFAVSYIILLWLCCYFNCAYYRMSCGKSHPFDYFSFQQCSPNLLLNKNQHPPNLIRPFANRRFNTLLPPTLSFLFIKPCFRLFLIMEGWYVRLMNQVERSPRRDWRPSIKDIPMDDIGDDVVVLFVAAVTDDDANTIIILLNDVFSWGNNVIPRFTDTKSSIEQSAEVAIQHRWPPWL